MRKLRRFFAQFANLFTRRRAERELDAELSAHLALLQEEFERRGLSPEQAQREARLKLGGIEQAKELHREARTLHWLETLWQDTRFACRMLRKNHVFTAIAVTILALGIGANTAIFSLIDALLLRSLPVRDPQELMLLTRRSHTALKYHSQSGYGDCRNRPTSGCTFSHPFFNDLSARPDIFADVTAFGGNMEMNVNGNGSATTAQGLFVSGSYFETLGVRPVAGRTIEPSDDAPAAPPVAMISYGYWQREFGGSLSAVGATVGLNGVPTIIVGVAERRFAGLTPGIAPDAWLPLSMRPRLVPDWRSEDDDAGSFWLAIIGRLRPAVSPGQAEAAVSLLFRDEMLHGAKPLSTEADEPVAALAPAQTALVGVRADLSKPLFILMAAVGIVLLIASANVAGLLLARSKARQKEMAVRLALGASRMRIVRQLLTESVLLSVTGAALGAVFAIWGARAIVAFVGTRSSEPLQLAASIDLRVLLFTAAIAIGSGVIFGLAPARRGTRVDLTPALKGGTSGPADRPRSDWFNAGNLLVAGQVALTMIVLVGAGLMVRTLQNLRSVDPGFDAANILNFRINPTLVGYKGPQLDRLYRDLQQELRGIPGVVSVSYSSVPLLVGWQSSTSYRLPGAPEKSTIESDRIRVSSDFFATTKMPLLEGRDFSSADFLAAAPGTPVSNSAVAPPKAPQAIIVNEAFVRRYLGKVNPMGQRLELSHIVPNDAGFVIIGVVGDARYTDLRGTIQPTTYVPATGGGVVFELRTATRPAAYVAAVRKTVNKANSNLPITDLMTESESIDHLLFQERMIARLSSFFGVLALVLACIGLYGLLSYEVSRRTREIGIRMALGADRRSVLTIIVGHGVALALAGLALGIVASLGLTRFLGSVLYDVRPDDPATIIAVAIVLLLVALTACWIPARRATRVDPMIALRHE